ncbi:hypothetical protein [Sphaerisporangium dianthi]|uniref:Guanylate cyclase domain-containing protein n=1 Tax=Sphaerisporangium dianthi TaxID=1436120 RepID=A0ABV9CM61_9ACTN
MEIRNQAIRRVCVAVDLESYSSRILVEQDWAQRQLVGMLEEADRRGDLGRERWITQQQGDGELALLQPGIDEAHVIPGLIRGLRTQLHERNRPLALASRLRMRLAVHVGLTRVAENGFAGDAVNTVCRLRDAPALKEALRAAPDSYLAVIVSQPIFQEVVRGHDLHDLQERSFTRTEIEIPDKNFIAEAWIHVPHGRSATPGAEPAAKPSPATARLPQNSSSSPQNSSSMKTKKFRGRDWVQGNVVNNTYSDDHGERGDR